MKSTSPPFSSRFSRCPVDKSSRIRTRAPLEISDEAMCEPIKPAPPVTSAIPESGILLPAHPHVFKAHLSHIFRFVDVSQVGNLRSRHQIANAQQVERAKLVPLGHEHECVRAFHRRVLVVSINNV